MEFQEIYNLIKEIVYSIGKKNNEREENLQDLIQDISLQIYLQPPDVTDGDLRYYLTKIVLNNIHSTTSRYYYKYKIKQSKLLQIDDYIDKL